MNIEHDSKFKIQIQHLPINIEFRERLHADDSILM